MQGAFHRRSEVGPVKRVAGVEPFLRSSLPGAPPAHDRAGGETQSGGEQGPRTTEYPPAQAFGRHFFRCFFCRIGDNRIEDHFCETGRELIVAMLDELDGRP